MSNTSSWTIRSQNYRYSFDDRTKQWKFEKELKPLIETFVDDVKQKTYILGPYNIVDEPWRAAAIVGLRRYGLKIIEVPNDDGTTSFKLNKLKLTKLALG